MKPPHMMLLGRDHDRLLDQAMMAAAAGYAVTVRCNCSEHWRPLLGQPMPDRIELVTTDDEIMLGIR